MEMLKHFIQCLSYHLKQCGTINQHLIRSNETYRFNFNNSNTCRSGISTILYVNSEISTRELSRLYVYAHHKGLKSLYYTRNKLLSVEECTSCAI